MKSRRAWTLATLVLVALACTRCKKPEVARQPAGDSATAAAFPNDDAPPATARALRKSMPGNCELEHTFADLFAHGAQAHVDCGWVGLDDSTQRQAAARRCALEAAQAEKSFSLAWDLHGIDTRMRVGIAGRRGDAGYELFWFEYNGGFANPHSLTHTCTELRDLRVTCRRQKRTADGREVTMHVLSDECQHSSPHALACAGRKEIARCP